MTNLIEDLTQTKYNKEYLNNRFIYEHGWSDRDSEIYNDVEQKFIEHYTNRPCQPMPNDTIIIKDRTGKHIFYKYAKIFKEDYSDTGLIYCESPYTPFITDDVERFSCSGGAWHALTNDELKSIKLVSKESKTRVCTWGSCGACGDGAIEVEVPNYTWELCIDREYIPFVVYKMHNSDYKWGLKNFNHNGYVNCKYISSCFETRAGLIKYLRNHKMKITGRFNEYYLKVEIAEDYTVVHVSNEKDYKELKKNAENVFAELQNGSYWETFTIGNKQYLPSVNGNIKPLDYHACRKIYG